MRTAVITALSVLTLLAGAGLVLSFAFPGDMVRDYLVAEIKAETGRDLTIAGPAIFSPLPSASVSLHDVTLSAPPDSTGPPVAHIAQVDVSVALWPLLWREVVVERVTLKDPVISLAVDSNGRANWSLPRAAYGPAPQVRVAQAQNPTTATDAPSPSAAFDALKRHNISDVSLRDISIDNGTVRYVDARSGKPHEVTAITAQLSAASLASPASLTGNLEFRGERLDVALELGALAPLLSSASTRISVKVTSPILSARYEGSIFPANSEAEGLLQAQTPSLARTIAWFGATLPRSADLGQLDLTGQLRSAGQLHTLSNATLTANSTTATGQVSLDTSPARPLVRGDLAIADLNLNALLSPLPAATPPGGAPPSRTDITAPDTTPPPPTTAGGPRINGFASRGGWSEEPIRLTALTAVDADLKLSLAAALYKDMKVGASRVTIAIANGLLKATIDDTALYGGRGHGFIVLDGRDDGTAHVGINLTLDKVAVRPLLQDVAQLSWIDGQGAATIAVAGSGPHQRAVIESLAGKADLRVTNGAVIGIDIDRMAASVADGQLGGLQAEPGDRTAFSALTATWQVSNGVARNNDMRLSSASVQVTGAGNIVLPDRALDYTIRPKLAAKGDQAGKGLAGIEVPVRVSGSWEKPTYKADVGGAAEELGRRLKGKDANEIVDELVGKDSKTGAKAKKLLDKLFR